MKKQFVLSTILIASFLAYAPLSHSETDPQESMATCRQETILEHWLHWLLMEIGVRKPEDYACFGPVVEDEFANTASAQFEKSLIDDGRYTKAIQKNEALLFRWQYDPYLKPVFDKGLPQDYRYVLRMGPSLRFLYGEPSGVGEGYTIGEHTVRVLEIYRDQKDHYNVAQFTGPFSTHSVDEFMQYTLAFHDIGKSIAFRGGDKNRETRYSVPLSWTLMKAAGFSDQESRLAMELIGQHQQIGSYLQGKVQLDEVREGIARASAASGVSEQQFFKLLEMIFIADAGSYPYLHDHVFRTDSSGKLVPVDDESYMEVKNLYQ